MDKKDELYNKIVSLLKGELTMPIVEEVSSLVDSYIAICKEEKEEARK